MATEATTITGAGLAIGAGVARGSIAIAALTSLSDRPLKLRSALVSALMLDADAGANTGLPVTALIDIVYQYANFTPLSVNTITAPAVARPHGAALWRRNAESAPLFVFVTNTNPAIHTLNLTTHVVNESGPIVASGVVDPVGLCVDRSDNSFLFTSYGNHLIRRAHPDSKAVTLVAGQSTVSGKADGIGSAAQFNYPFTIICSARGAPFAVVADYWNSLIRRIDLSTYAVTTIAGTGADFYYSRDGAAPELFATPQPARKVAVPHPLSVSFDTTDPTADPDANVFVVSQHIVFRLHIATGMLSLVFEGDRMAKPKFDIQRVIPLDRERVILLCKYQFFVLNLKSKKVALLTGTGRAEGEADGDPLQVAWDHPSGYLYVSEDDSSLASGSGLRVGGCERLYVCDSMKDRIRVLSGSILATATDV